MKIKKKYQGTVPENKILDTHSQSNTDTYSCNYVNGLETYSTSEKRSGTWVDGKPIYRKVVNNTFNSIGAVGANVINQYSFNHNIPDIDQVTHAEMRIKGSGYNFPYIGTNGYGLMWTGMSHVTSSSVIIKVLNDTWGSLDCYFIIEYTKTTD